MKHATNATLTLAAAIGLSLVTAGCAERRTTVRRETSTVRSQPRIVEEHTVVTPPPAESETTVIERRRHVTEEDR